MNPFIATRRMTDSKEDHLTEFIAAALELDPRFRDGYATAVLGAFAQRKGWAPPKIVAIATQVKYPEFRSIIDMTLTLEDGHVIAVEHKLEAPETEITIDYAEEPSRQLMRYLAIPTVDAVAFFRTSLKPPIATVLADPKYVMPANRQHYMWRDLFPLLRDSDHKFSRWVREGFERDGFTPPHPLVGDLSDAAAARNFAMLWTATRARAVELGWKVGAGSVVELYLSRSDPYQVQNVWLNPWNNLLLVRASPVSGHVADELFETISKTAQMVAEDVTVKKVKARGRVAGPAEVVDSSAPLPSVLDGARDGEAAETRLLRFVEPFLLALP